MNTTKLTLTIPKEIFGRANTYSKKTKQSLSEIITDYLNILSPNLKPRKKHKITKRVKKLTGILKTSKKINEKEMLQQILEEKYLLQK